jgi:thiol:disulfide interchange protein DsbA
MIRIRLLILATVLSVATACGKAPETQSPAPAAATAETAPIAAPAPAADAAPDTAPAITAVEESAGTDSVGTEAAGKEAAAPPDATALGKDIVLAANSSGVPEKTDWQYKEGPHFNALTTAQGTSSSSGKIEVAEVFWYGCSHCYALEPLITDWVKKLPGDVTFVRIPVMWNPTNEIHGRIYYTAEALGKLDQITPAMFRAIHVENRPVTEEKDIQLLFEQNGVSAADFNKAFRSFSVESQLKRAKDLTVRYRVKGVPLLVVNGKYTTDGPEIRNQQDMLAVTEELIQRERQRASPRS